MKLRGHHLFCTALFSGHGYDPAFTESMTAVIAAAEAGEPLILQTSPDEICTACPHRLKEEGCALGTENVLHRDREALRVLGLIPGQKVTWAETRPLLAQVTAEEFRRVCGDCRWQQAGYCSAALLRERTK